MKKLYFTLLILIFSLEIIAQNNWIEGTIVTNDNIEIKGYINDKGWLKSPENIEFKSYQADTIQTLTPKDIKSFKTKDIYYISQTMEIIDAQIEIDFLSQTPKPNFVTKSIFLKVLIDSKLSLYYHQDQNFKEHFFVKKDSGKIEELIQFKYLQSRKDNIKYNEINTVQTKNIIVENKKYVGQLKYLLNDCPQIKGFDNTLAYSKNSISKKIKKYNICLGFENQFYNKKKIEIELSVKGGISYSSLVFKSGDNSVLEHNFSSTTFSKSLDPTFAITGDLILPYWNNHIAAYIDINYFTYNSEGSSFYDDVLSDWEFENEINASYIGTTIGLKYFYPIGNIKLFIGIGMANSFVLDFDSKLVKKLILSPTNSIITESELFPDYRKYASGIAIEPGVEFYNFIIQFKYTRDNAMSDLLAVKSNTNNIGFLIGYKIRFN